jgi:tRNA (guanine37-N1)-methyltransferase
MQIDIVTIFPAMVEQALAAGIVGRAIERGTLTVKVHDLRAFTSDRHRVVDDVPYGGGPGMVLKPEPLLRAVEAISVDGGAAPTVVLTSPQGTRFSQPVAARLSRLPRLLLLCGRYEGVDERVRTVVDEEISIGDYVLSGGELPALVIADGVARLVPGVVGDEQSVVHDSFSRGLLDFPQYTRPAEVTVRGESRLEPTSDDPVEPTDVKGATSLKVPDVLLSGNHREIRRWRKQEAVARTLARRPDLLDGAELDEEEQAILRDLNAELDRKRT